MAVVEAVLVVRLGIVTWVVRHLDEWVVVEINSFWIRSCWIQLYGVGCDPNMLAFAPVALV